VKDMKVGEIRCDRFDIITETDAVNASEDYIDCQVISKNKYFSKSFPKFNQLVYFRFPL
jgi:hypothetical protein